MFLSNIERVIDWDPPGDSICHACRAQPAYCVTYALHHIKYYVRQGTRDIEYMDHYLCRNCFDMRKNAFKIYKFPNSFDYYLHRTLHDGKHGFDDYEPDFVDNATAIVGEYHGDITSCTSCGIYDADKILVRASSLIIRPILMEVFVNFSTGFICNQCVDLTRHQNRKFNITLDYDQITDKIRNYH
jgi:hypothetical protein